MTVGALTIPGVYSLSMSLGDYVTVKEAKEHVSYSAYWLRVLADTGKVKAVKIGTGFRGQWLLHLPSLLKYTKEMEELGPAKHDPTKG